MKIGKPCRKHPELGGKRHNGGNCVECTKAAKKAYNAKNKDRVRAAMREYQANNKERVKELNANWRRANKLKLREINLRRAGFTPELFQEAVAAQGGKCAICQIGFDQLPQKQVHADHCHATGMARGVLCHHCNAGLGAFRDSTENLARAMNYLDNPTLSLL